ncbi:MAG: hypothetical protein HC926_02015, partial [Synechococcaceae cyanobacterium SM2_3_60]|nr:hypothetical protein [Synechococcaceae cyanobacterium SM2_3_60]
MLARVGFTQAAYSWRPEHVPLFDREMKAYRQHGIHVTAVWQYRPETLDLIRRHRLQTCLWEIFRPEWYDEPEATVLMIREKARTLAELGCRYALYDHGRLQPGAAAGSRFHGGSGGD